MATGIIDIMKRASIDAMENSKLCDLRYGSVISVTPLKVQVTPQFILPESVLIVPMHLTDYETELSFDDPDIKQEYTTWDMGEKIESAPSKMSFKKKIKHKITVYNALKVGDKVALLRKQGGQSYFILDRI